jgi:hypothetical protein
MAVSARSAAFSSSSVECRVSAASSYPSPRAHCAQGAVPRHFIMFNGLRDSQQTCIKRRRPCVILQDLRTLIGNAEESVTRLCLWLRTDHTKNHFKARHVFVSSRCLQKADLSCSFVAARSMIGRVPTSFCSAKYTSLRVSRNRSSSSFDINSYPCYGWANAASRTTRIRNQCSIIRVIAPCTGATKSLLSTERRFVTSSCEEVTMKTDWTKQRGQRGGRWDWRVKKQNACSHFCAVQGRLEYLSPLGDRSRLRERKCCCARLETGRKCRHGPILSKLAAIFGFQRHSLLFQAFAFLPVGRTLRLQGNHRHFLRFFETPPRRGAPGTPFFLLHMLHVSLRT